MQTIQVVRCYLFQLKTLQLQTIPGEEPKELPVLSDEELSEVDTNKLQYAITKLEEQLKQQKPNLTAIQEYKKKVSSWID